MGRTNEARGAGVRLIHTLQWRGGSVPKHVSCQHGAMLRGLFPRRTVLNPQATFPPNLPSGKRTTRSISSNPSPEVQRPSLEHPRNWWAEWSEKGFSGLWGPGSNPWRGIMVGSAPGGQRDPNAPKVSSNFWRWNTTGQGLRTGVCCLEIIISRCQLSTSFGRGWAGQIGVGWGGVGRGGAG